MSRLREALARPGKKLVIYLTSGDPSQETTVELLLYDFTFKDLVKDGECPFDLTSGGFTGGSIVSQTYDAVITFRGLDDANRGYNITESYNSTFANFDNCEEE